VIRSLSSIKSMVGDSENDQDLMRRPGRGRSSCSGRKETLFDMAAQSYESVPGRSEVARSRGQGERGFSSSRQDGHGFE
jgi:hypothetical protein